MAAPRPLIALLEADRHVAGALQLLAGDWGYECLAETSLAAMLATLTGHPAQIAAVIADPDALTDGDPLPAATLRRALDPSVPILITSTSADAGEASDVDVMMKPYDPEALRRWLNLNAVLS